MPRYTFPMDSSQGSSFIPKSPVRGAVTKRRVRKVYLITYLIYVFFVGSLLASAGIWFYKFTVQNDLDAVKLALNEERDRFKQSDLEMVSQLNLRMKEADRLLSEQVSVANLLRAIESTMVLSVDLAGFLYEKDISGELRMTLNAQADDFNSTLFQRQVLASNPVLAGANMVSVAYGTQEGDATTQPEDTITFVIAKSIDPTTIVPTAIGTSVPASTPSATPDQQGTTSPETAANDAVIDALLSPSVPE